MDTALDFVLLFSLWKELHVIYYADLQSFVDSNIYGLIFVTKPVKLFGIL